MVQLSDGRLKKKKGKKKEGKALQCIHFKKILKEVTDSADLISSGSSFHSLQALTVNAQSPLVYSHASGKNKSPLSENFRLCIGSHSTKRSDKKKKVGGHKEL